MPWAYHPELVEGTMIMQEKVTVVSVVRDNEMYSRCISGNPCLKGCKLVAIDNRSENLAVTSRYNAFIDSIDHSYDGWVVFCHEDWEAGENLAARLQGLDPNYIYGPIGVFVEERKGADVMIMRGYVAQNAKDGRKKIVIRGKDEQGRVDCFDCQCIIVHSSLLRKFGLRFDARLSFDMYAEDFCAGAYERHAIESMAIKMECRHHSQGRISASFKDALEYVRHKYAGSRKRYASIVGHLNTFGGADPRKRVYKWKRIPWIRLRYRLCR